MPTFDICKTGTAAECGSIFIDDQTVYGVAPESRVDYALFLAGFFYQEDVADARITIDNTLPETVAQWEITTASDGYYYFDLMPVLIWDTDLTYLEGDIRYQNTFYWKSLADANQGNIPTDTADVWWELVADPYLEKDSLNSASAASILNVTREDSFTLCRADICYKRVVHDAAKEGCKKCDKFVSRNLMRVDSLVQDAYMLVAQTRYTEAHKLALLLQDVCNDLTDCGCP